MLVDDDVDITSSVKVGLGDYSFTVSVYNDPQIALSEFNENLYDLLLTDIRMPGMGGLELYEKMKKIDNKIRVCFITGFKKTGSRFQRPIRLMLQEWSAFNNW